MADETIFEIGGEKYDVVKTGMAQAEQFSGIGQWLSNYGAPVIQKATEQGSDLLGSNIGMLLYFLGAVSTEALLSAFMLVFGCTRKVAEKYFDFSLLTDGLVALFKNQPAISRITSRFFSVQRSNLPEEETVTSSDQPTE